MSRHPDGDDTPPTRSYVDALLRGNLSTDEVANLRAEIASRAEEESARLARSYPPPSSSQPPRGGSIPPRLGSIPPRGGSHPPSAPPPASWPSPRSYAPIPRDDDDQRTVARSYRPAELRPISYVPPDDIAHPYVFDDDPLPEPEADGEGLTAVHVYSASEIGDMVNLGDLGDLVPPGLSAELPPPQPDTELVEDYLGALGGPQGIPCLAVHPAQVPSLPIGPQAAFVLSRIDGGSTVEDVLDMAGLSRVETLRILYELFQQGIIRVEGSEP